MRKTIWNAVRTKVPEGEVLPWWALTVRAVLFPLDFFYWRMSQTRGYQWRSDTWLIEGATYSGEVLRNFAQVQGETCQNAKHHQALIAQWNNKITTLMRDSVDEIDLVGKKALFYGAMCIWGCVEDLRKGRQNSAPDASTFPSIPQKSSRHPFLSRLRMLFAIGRVLLLRR